MVLMSMLPGWNQIAAGYPYAPGRTDETNEQWAQMRAAGKKARQELRDAAKADAKALKEYDEAWNQMTEENNPLLTSRDELPGRNTDVWTQNPQDYTKSALMPGFGLLGELSKRAVEYLPKAAENPQGPGEFGLAWARDTGEEAGKWLLSLLGWDLSEEEEPELKPWLEQYIASGGGSGAGAGVDAALAGTPFPDIKVGMDLSRVRDLLGKVKKPEYKEEAFNPQLAIANMLMNADWVNMDMSKAGQVMQEAFNRRAKNNADVANANEEARAEQERWAVARELALEELKAKQALQQAEFQIAKWQASQPRALGGNKMAWRDAAGNLHFQQVDKQGEARTVGQNAAMIEMLDADGKKMTPKKILQRANQAALLYPDKDKMPFIQGYIMQATSMLPAREEK